MSAPAGPSFSGGPVCFGCDLCYPVLRFLLHLLKLFLKLLDPLLVSDPNVLQGLDLLAQDLVLTTIT